PGSTTRCSAVSGWMKSTSTHRPFPHRPHKKNRSGNENGDRGRHPQQDASPPFLSQESHETRLFGDESSDSELPVSVQTAQVDGLVPQVVDRPDVTDRAAAGAHEDGMGHRLLAGHLHPRQQRAVTDAGLTEPGALALNQVLHTEHASEFCLAPLRAKP